MPMYLNKFFIVQFDLCNYKLVDLEISDIIPIERYILPQTDEHHSKVKDEDSEKLKKFNFMRQLNDLNHTPLSIRRCPNTSKDESLLYFLCGLDNGFIYIYEIKKDHERVVSDDEDE